MPKSREVATELRKLADALDTIPETEIKRPYVSFYHHSESEKEGFLAIARVLPHPLTKDYGEDLTDKLTVEYKTDAIIASASIPRFLVCRIVEPAKPAVYDCQPLLSAEEEMGISA